MLKLKETIKCLKFAKTSLAETGLITESFVTYLTKKKTVKHLKGQEENTWVVLVPSWEDQETQSSLLKSSPFDHC